MNVKKAPKFYILDQNFQAILYLADYESILWVERYNSTGDFELYTPPTKDLLEACKLNNYLMYTDSPELMIIESVNIKGNIESGSRLIVTGRTLESILDRRILMLKTYISGFLEGGIIQLLNWAIINPRDNHGVSAPGRRISNFKFEYSDNEEVSHVEVDYEYEKGTELLDVIQEMCQKAGIGFYVRRNESNQLVFKLYKGEDRSFDQDENPWVVFSPGFCNLITSSSTEDNSEMKNLIYTEGEVYKEQAPMEIYTGNTTGLMRREYYNNASHIAHEPEEGIVLDEDEYRRLLVQSGNDAMYDHKLNKKVEGEVEPTINFTYGHDYFMGDIVQLSNEYGFNERVRVTEFIIAYDTNGLQMYPTFTAVEES